MTEQFAPSGITTEEWYTHTRLWNPESYFDAAARISPDTACAGQEGAWEITVQLGQTGLEAGDRFAVEVSVGNYLYLVG